MIKLRVARCRQGASGGFRTIVLYRTRRRAFFVYGFAKSDRANIDSDELLRFKKAATYVLALTDEQLDKLMAAGQFMEVHADDQEISK